MKFEVGGSMEKEERWRERGVGGYHSGYVENYNLCECVREEGRKLT